MRELIEETREIFEVRRQSFNIFDRWYNKIKKTTRMKLSNDNRFDAILNDQELLFTKGRIVYAHLVQANSLLFQPGKLDLPAAIVFSEDPYYEDNVFELEEIAGELYNLKGKIVEDNELKLFSDVITDEMTALYNVEIPKKITNNRTVYYSTIVIYRKHIPLNYLRTSWLPILINPSIMKSSMILPYKYWSQEMINKWCE